MTPTSALQHVLATVLGFGDDSPAAQALSIYGATDIYDLLSIPESDFATLSYVRDTPIPPAEEGGSASVRRDVLSLTPMIQRKLILVCQWHAALSDVEPVTVLQWHNLTADAFNEFRVSKRTPQAPSSTPPVDSTSTRNDPYTVEWDVSKYKALKEGKR